MSSKTCSPKSCMKPSAPMRNAARILPCHHATAAGVVARVLDEAVEDRAAQRPGGRRGLATGQGREAAYRSRDAAGRHQVVDRGPRYLDVPGVGAVGRHAPTRDLVAIQPEPVAPV